MEYGKELIKNINTDFTRDDLRNTMLSELNPIKWVYNNLGITLLNNQVDIVKSVLDFSVKNLAILQARGGGKSYAVVIGLIKLCVENREFRVGVFAPKADQATRLIEEIYRVVTKNTNLYSEINWKTSTKSRIFFKNGSDILAISAAPTAEQEGWHFHCVVIDECHRTEDIVISQRILPMLGSFSVTKLIKIGITAGKNNFWKSCVGNTNYRVLKRSWLECPRLFEPGSFSYKGIEYPLDVAEKLPLKLKQEFFPDLPELHFDGEMSEIDFRTHYAMDWVSDIYLELSEDDQKLLVSGTHTILKEGLPQQGDVYFFGLDTAGGSYQPGKKDLDFTVLSIWRKRSDQIKEKVACFEWSGDILTQYDEIKQIIHPQYGIFKCAFGLADLSNTATAFVPMFKNEKIAIDPIVFNQTDPMSKKNYKNAMFNQFKFELQHGRIKFPSIDVINTSAVFKKSFNEWCNIERHAKTGINDKIEAPSDLHDDHCCFSGDTKIRLLDGTTKTIRELSELDSLDNIWVYSIDESKNIVPGKVFKAWKTGTKETVKVTIDSGESFYCTPDHLIMLRDGTYKKAEELQPNDSLMPLYTEKKIWYKNLDYEFVYNPATQIYIPTHKLFTGEISFDKKDAKGSFIKNHKVVSVETSIIQDVYDITVDVYHNFALDSGVFVHNCADVLAVWAMDQTKEFRNALIATRKLPKPVISHMTTQSPLLYKGQQGGQENRYLK